MKKSAIFFVIFLLALLVAVITERQEKKDFPSDVVMGEETTAQSLNSNLNLEVPK